MDGLNENEEFLACGKKRLFVQQRMNANGHDSEILSDSDTYELSSECTVSDHLSDQMKEEKQTFGTGSSNPLNNQVDFGNFPGMASRDNEWSSVDNPLTGKKSCDVSQGSLDVNSSLDTGNGTGETRGPRAADVETLQECALVDTGYSSDGNRPTGDGVGVEPDLSRALRFAECGFLESRLTGERWEKLWFVHEDFVAAALFHIVLTLGRVLIEDVTW